MFLEEAHITSLNAFACLQLFGFTKRARKYFTDSGLGSRVYGRDEYDIFVGP
jgi:hypothetical protein